MSRKFKLKEKVAITVSGESGEVIGIAEYVNQKDKSYLVRYMAGDGRAVESWWAEDALMGEFTTLQEILDRIAELNAEIALCEAAIAAGGEPGDLFLYQMRIQQARDEIVVLTALAESWEDNASGKIKRSTQRLNRG